ncbi:ABC transporter ATP-binding protein [Prochlorococcus marinus]|uniref:Possible ABC transporter, ATP binding component n=1 Tax=Prochlorococcus marinus (strain MIT 9211) TaxID=93059 RepID=A9BDT7_PROM4|nr:ATP-binding cassette domain-containing protein [Prochlorococcus marinus]ABX08247.1 possible ABC transporter, ATP binding component [Prochlorococcus marinus str. MIT 9211]
MEHSKSIKTQDNAEPIVEIENLLVEWDSKPVLNKFNLVMKPGEKIAIIGPSGCGKSTTLRVLAGLLLPTSGNLKLFGSTQSYLRLDQTNPPDVRLVFQNPALLGSLTVEENVGFLLRKNQSMSESKIKEIVISCLQEVGLYNVSNKLPSQLSGGMQKRVSFARALVKGSSLQSSSMPLLLFDEPTSGLDPIACTRIEDLIIKTTNVAKGCSIVVSHVMSTIERSAERVLMLYGGKIQWDGTIKEFKESDNSFIKQFRTGSLQGPIQPEII